MASLSSDLNRPEVRVLIQVPAPEDAQEEGFPPWTVYKDFTAAVSTDDEEAPVVALLLEDSGGYAGKDFTYTFSGEEYAGWWVSDPVEQEPLAVPDPLYGSMAATRALVRQS